MQRLADGYAIAQPTVAFDQLQRHDLLTLFTQTLGWSRLAQPEVTLSNIADDEIDQGIERPHRLRFRPLGLFDSEHQKTAWALKLPDGTAFSTPLRRYLYQMLKQYLQRQSTQPSDQNNARSYADPLLILINAAGKRSLWCSGSERSVVYVSGQPMTVWAYRLEALRLGHCHLALPIVRETTAGDDSALAFKKLLHSLEEGITGVQGSSRTTYALLTFQRLILLEKLQQRGWMNGDRWYLQTLYGQSMMNQTGSFFRTQLQPLYQALALPTVERPIALQEQFGQIPYLGQFFQTHSIAVAAPTIDIADQALEDCLGWLSEQANTPALMPWIADDLSLWMMKGVSRSSRFPSAPSTSPPAAALPELQAQLCRSGIDAYLLKQLGQPQMMLNDVLFSASTHVCRQLIQEILPSLKVLDPSCDRGFTLGPLFQHLSDIYSILTGCISRTKDAQLKIWYSGIQQDMQENQLAGHTPSDISEETNQRRILTILQRRILRNNLFGLTANEAGQLSAHFLLLSQLVAAAGLPADLEPLPDLTFNIPVGNALVGFIDVDEQRFDAINRREADGFLQGNLLQPLAADSYQTILSEKNISLEFYLSRAAILAETNSVPAYARAELMRDKVLDLDKKAADKLNQLLLDYMSGQLGLKFRQTQLNGKPTKRLLERADIEAMQPFHWGYSFYSAMKQGGFDVVVCLPEEEAFKPTVADCLDQHPALARAHHLSAKTFKRSKAALQAVDEPVATAWLDYFDKFECAIAYLKNSEQFSQQRIPSDPQRRTGLNTASLYLERCIHLSKPHGQVAVVMPLAWVEAEAKTILHERVEAGGEVVLISLAGEMRRGGAGEQCLINLAV